MDDGHKQKLIVAGLAALALGAGSYFTLSGKSAPPPERQLEQSSKRRVKPEAPPAPTRRRPRVGHTEKTAPPQRNFRQRHERPKQERKQRDRSNTQRKRPRVKDIRGA